MAKDNQTIMLEKEHLIEAWKKSEDVAMHFNELLMGFRLKAIGGIAIGATIAVGLKLSDARIDHSIATVFFAVLATIWLLIWAAEFFYYYRLLAGAVDELLRIEQRLGDVFLSHQIEHRIKRNCPAAKTAPTEDPTFLYASAGTPPYPTLAIWLFYLVPLVILIAVTILIAFGYLF
jgi:hypothetical protein